MRHLAAVALTTFGIACSGSATDVGAVSPAGLYALGSIDEEPLPAHLDFPGGASEVVSGSLTLLPNGYFVLAESDTVWNGHVFVREDWTDGGTWTADGAILALSDTSAEGQDAYGAETSTYVGTIALHTAWVPIPSRDGRKIHVYRYER